MYFCKIYVMFLFANIVSFMRKFYELRNYYNDMKFCLH